MRTWIIGGAAVIAAGTAGLALAQQAAAPAIPHGYLADMPDPAAILRPAPKPGDARDLEDRRIFEASRKLEGSARWKMAQADVPYGIAAQMGGFSCAVGVTLTPQTAPKLAALIGRTSIDVGRLNMVAKNAYGRPRPYARWGGNICTPASPMLDESLDYPSGHAQLGWTNALVLAELAPDRATQILARGRAFAESRAVCGVHTVSATEAGMTLASAQIAASRANPAFKADIDAARAELEALRASGAKPDAAACAAEPELNKSPF
jgi:acid phosphatase (class A)